MALNCILKLAGTVTRWFYYMLGSPIAGCLRLWVDGPHRRPDEVNPSVRERVQAMQRHIFEIPVPDDVEEIPVTSPALGRLGEVKAPTLVIVGELDLEEKVTLADRLVAEMPNAKKKMMPEAAHMMNMEKPEEFNHLVLEFLANLENRPQNTLE